MSTQRHHWITCVSALLVAATSVLGAQAPRAKGKPLTLEQMEKVAELDDLLGQLDDMKALVDKVSRTTQTQCLRAFGNVTFCECLRDNLPAVVSFGEYVGMVLASPEDIKGMKLTAEDKQLLDVVLGARETCVARGGA